MPGSTTFTATRTATEGAAIRPFEIDTPQAAIDELRRLVTAALVLLTVPIGLEVSSEAQIAALTVILVPAIVTEARLSRCAPAAA